MKYFLGFLISFLIGLFTLTGVPDLVIGTVAIVPYADGFIDPVKVRLLVDENEKPVRANEKFAVVLEYIYG